MNFFKALWEAICETTVEQIEEIKQAELPQEQSSYNDEELPPMFGDMPSPNDTTHPDYNIYY